MRPCRNQGKFLQMRQLWPHPLVDREIDSTCASQILLRGANARAMTLVTGRLNLWKADLRIHARSVLTSEICALSRFEAFASFNSTTHAFDPIAA